MFPLSHRRVLLALAAACVCGAQQTPPDISLTVSRDGHFMVKRSGGEAVFLLGDTAWTLAHLINREDVPYYLEHRRNQGFNMIFMSGVTEGGGLAPNALGDKPYRSKPAAAARQESNVAMPTICPAETDPAVVHDFTQPLVTDGNDPNNAQAYDYWDHLEYIIQEAAKRSVYIALNPVVGTCYVRDGHVTVENAEGIGQFFGKRFGGYSNVVWVLGGDIAGDNKPEDLVIYRNMAKGIALGALGKEDHSRLVMTYHPRGRTSSSTALHNERWLTLNWQQTGQSDLSSYETIAKDYALSPAKPVMDGEAWYEELPNRIRLGNRHANDYDVRKRAYWAVLAGAAGHIYGENSVMQFWAPGVEPYRDIPTIHWKQALYRPGATQMQFLRKLIESRPMLERIPDQSLLAGAAEEFNDRRQAARGTGYAFIYSSVGNVVEVHMGRIGGDKAVAWWFNPRDGSATKIGEFANTGDSRFQPPTSGIGQDWVLVLDDASKGFPAPGKDLRMR